MFHRFLYNTDLLKNASIMKIIRRRLQAWELYDFDFEELFHRPWQTIKHPLSHGDRGW
jgi:hypothetical protein